MLATTLLSLSTPSSRMGASSRPERTSTQTSNYRALKGGSVKHGIVNDFKMPTVKCERVWRDMTREVFFKDNIPAADEAVHGFINLTNVTRYPDDHLMAMFTYLPTFGDIVIATPRVAYEKLCVLLRCHG